MLIRNLKDVMQQPSQGMNPLSGAWPAKKKEILPKLHDHIQQDWIQEYTYGRVILSLKYKKQYDCISDGAND